MTNIFFSKKKTSLLFIIRNTQLHQSSLVQPNSEQKKSENFENIYFSPKKEIIIKKKKKIFTVYYLLSTIYCLLSTVYCLLSAVYCLPTTDYCLLSTVYCLLYTVYYLPSGQILSWAIKNIGERALNK